MGGQAMNQVLVAKGAVVASRCGITGVDGTVVWIKSAMITTDDNDTVLWALHDITPLVQAEEQLRVLTAEFKKAKDQLRPYESPPHVRHESDGQIKWVTYNDMGQGAPGISQPQVG